MRIGSISVPMWLPRWGLVILSVVGWGLFARMLLINVLGSISLVGEEIGGMGWDTYAYWLAGMNVRAGEPVYWSTAFDVLGAYQYPPPFAQMWAPLSYLPEAIADWGWRLLGVLSVRYMAGSWQIAGIWWLYPGSIVEITAGNVTFQVAALTVAGLRGRAEGIFPATLVKFSAGVVVPYIWLRRPRARRGLLVGAALSAAVVLLSILLDPGLWRDYLAAVSSQTDLTFDGSATLHILPSPSADYLLRIVLALAVIVVAVRADSPRLAFIASVIAIPTIWPQRLSILFALLTLQDDKWLRPYLWPRRPETVSASQPVPTEA